VGKAGISGAILKKVGGNYAKYKHSKNEVGGWNPAGEFVVGILLPVGVSRVSGGSGVARCIGRVEDEFRRTALTRNH